MYAGVLIWYGIVIPSCYLINSSDNKKSIIEEGWVNGILKLYKKKDPNDKYAPAKPKNSENRKHDIKPGAHQANTTQEEDSNTWASRPKPHSIKMRQKETSETCKKDSFYAVKFQLRRGIILQDLEDIS